MADILFSITIGLAAVLLVLVIILIIERSISKKAKDRLARALEDKGIEVVKEKKPFKLFKSHSTDDIAEKIDSILDHERHLEDEQKVLTNKLKEMFESKENQRSSGIIDEDVKKVLKMVDDLLEKLPDDIIEQFTKSEDFKLYKKVIEKAK
jgi:flagellar biosynthesis/type III secretory pathway M-ring protein FliF/YscJ